MRRAYTLQPLGHFLCFATLLCANSNSGSAQTTPSYHPGALIRLRTSAQPSEWQVGTFLGRDSDSIRIQLPALSRPASIPVLAITSLEISSGRRSNSRKGALIGGLVGVGTGLLFIPAAAEACEDTCVLRVPAAIALLAGVLGGAGAGVGALIGSASTSERWQPASPWQLSVLGSPDQIGVRLSLLRH